MEASQTQMSQVQLSTAGSQVSTRGTDQESATGSEINIDQIEVTSEAPTQENEEQEEQEEQEGGGQSPRPVERKIIQFIPREKPDPIAANVLFGLFFNFCGCVCHGIGMATPSWSIYNDLTGKYIWPGLYGAPEPDKAPDAPPGQANALLEARLLVGPADTYYGIWETCARSDLINGCIDANVIDDVEKPELIIARVTAVLGIVFSVLALLAGVYCVMSQNNRSREASHGTAVGCSWLSFMVIFFLTTYWMMQVHETIKQDIEENLEGRSEPQNVEMTFGYSLYFSMSGEMCTFMGSMLYLTGYTYSRCNFRH